MNSLSIERLRSALSQAGVNPEPAEEAVETQEYTWDRPHAFSSSQLKKLEFFANRLTHSLARRLSLFMQKSMEASVDSITQNFTDQFLKQLAKEQKSSYYISFGKPASEAIQQPDSLDLFGFFNIPHNTAIRWSTELLGDPVSQEESDRELSPLEESVLGDIGEKIVEVTANAHDSFNFKASPGVKCTSEQILIDWHGIEAFYTITFSMKEAESSEEGFKCQVLFLCDKLMTLAGSTEAKKEQLPASEISIRLLEQLKKVNVTAVAQLDKLELPLDELLSLQPGDTLLLNKSVNEPIELVANDKTLFYGQPAKSGGRYSIIISEIAQE